MPSASTTTPNTAPHFESQARDWPQLCTALREQVIDWLHARAPCPLHATARPLLTLWVSPTLIANAHHSPPKALQQLGQWLQTQHIAFKVCVPLTLPRHQVRIEARGSQP